MDRHSARDISTARRHQRRSFVSGDDERLFDSDLRTTAVAVCTAANWLTNWLVVRLFPMLADMGLEVAYGLFIALAVLAFLFALKILPETRDRPLG